MATSNRSSIGQTVQHNRERYFSNLAHGTPGSGWDAVVLTAGSALQASYYEHQIETRRRQGLLPSFTEFLVVSDPPGHRVGSGGSTLLALKRLMQHFADPSNPGEIDGLRGRKLLILHSGGESRRLPLYSGTGKLFARVPLAVGYGVSTLFDEFLVSLSGAPRQFREGLVVASGDVLLLFDAQQLHFHSRGIVGVSMPAEPATACRHGVYLADTTGRVQRFLHKQNPESLAQAGAIHNGMAPIDTGIVWFDLATLQALKEATAADFFPPENGTPTDHPTQPQALSLYADLLAIPAADTRLDEYLNSPGDKGPPSPALRALREVLWNKLRGTPFHVAHLRDARFIHFGTSAEYHEALRAGCRPDAGLEWRSRLAVSGGETVTGALPPPDCVLLNSFCREPTNIEGMLIEDSFLGGGVTGRNGLISRVRAHHTKVDLPPDTVLFQAPVLRSGETLTATFILGMHDELKTPLTAGGTWMNRCWMDLVAAGLLDKTPSDTGEQASSAQPTLWDASLFPVHSDSDESLQRALRLAHGITQSKADEPVNSPRLEPSATISLRDALAAFDSQQVVDDASDLTDRIAAGRFNDAVAQGHPALACARPLGQHAADIGRRLGLAIADSEARGHALRDLHSLYCAGDALSHHCDPATNPELWKQATRYHDQAFERLAGLIRARRPPAPAKCKERHRTAVSVRAAARLDFGGGWSDTPPFSLCRPGTVLNAAISLNGELPISVKVEHLADPVIELHSLDQDISATIKHRGPIQDYRDPADPFALHKAALVLCGAVPEAASGADPFNGGGGLRVTTDIDVPKGSGLGTSSILAGALLTALYQAFGITRDQTGLFQDIFDLEQMLTTGGGWQDQVGGLTPGIKLTVAEPDIPPRLDIRPINPDPAIAKALDQRLLLIYTGRRRLAKGILRTIMGRYLANDPEVHGVLSAIQDVALEMQTALLAGDLTQLGCLMTRHWELNKQMDPGSTTPTIDALFETLTPHIAGGKLAGAGGGGFIEAIARAPISDHEAIKELLADRFPEAAVWPCQIVEVPLRVEQSKDQ